MSLVKSIKAALGDNLRRLRKSRGWTQEDLAHEAGFSSEHIKRLETQSTWISAEAVEKLAQALGCPETELFVDPAAVFKPTPREAMEVIIDSLNLEGKLKPKKKEL